MYPTPLLSASLRHSHQSGFTLIELMISLVLGLLISAAVVQIYLTNARTSSIQKSGSELQDASVFGVQLLESHLRLANLGNTIGDTSNQITDTTPNGGIVLTSGNTASNVIANPAIDSVYLSRTAGDTPTGNDTNKGWTGVSNMTNGSDQITLQFKNVTGSAMPDCEGTNIDDGEMVIERYFLRPSTTGSQPPGAVKNLVLACDAGRVNETTGVTNFGSAQTGQEFIQNVDQFKVLLGVQSITTGSAGNIQFLSSTDYQALTTKPAIVAVKIGLVVHGSTPIVGSGEDLTTFTLLGTPMTLKPDATRSKQVRKTYESTTMLRNARVTIA